MALRFKAQKQLHKEMRHTKERHGAPLSIHPISCVASVLIFQPPEQIVHFAIQMQHSPSLFSYHCLPGLFQSFLHPASGRIALKCESAITDTHTYTPSPR